MLQNSQLLEASKCCEVTYPKKLLALILYRNQKQTRLNSNNLCILAS